MKSRIYKSLISILIISMLTMSGIAIASARSPGPTPTPTSTAEAVQNQRLTNLEANDTNQSVNNTEQQNWISGLFEAVQGINKQLALLGNRVTNLETSVTNLVNDPYPAVYYSPSKLVDINQTYTDVELNSLTIDLPKDANVYVTSSGQMGFWLYFTNTRITIDDRGPTSGLGSWALNQPSWTPLQNSFTEHLTAGSHTIKMYGNVYGFSGNYAEGWADITAFVYDKGNVSTPPIFMAKLPPTTPQK